MAEKRWFNKSYSMQEFNNLMKEYNFSRPIALSLASREVLCKNVDKYFNASLNDLSSPYRLPGTKEASIRLWDAIRKDEHIVIHGDFDVDGITASALLSWILAENGANVSVFIPHRLDTGYGFTPDSLDNLLSENKCNVLVTVDCGITSNEAIDKANEMGIEVIITDHHEQGDEIPKAKTIINSKLHPELDDLHGLAGVGTAFKLAHAFLKFGLENGLVRKKIDLKEILDLVALGTVADIVPLLGENRILTKYGLKILSRQIRPGIRALCEACGINHNLKSNDIAFKLAPHINAAGRLGDPHVSYNLLNTNNIVDAIQLAQELKTYNLKRREKEKEIFDAAELQINQRIKINESSSILIYGESWHQGVIGNVASRIAREYNRPSIVLTVIDGQAYGSGRAAGKINLVEILSESSDLLTRYGGHPMAVGLSLNPEDIDALSLNFEKSVKNIFSMDDLIPQIEYDGDIFISELDDIFFHELETLEPFGHSNPQPVYRIKDLSTPYVTNAGPNHSRGYVRDYNYKSLPFIAFNMPPKTLPKAPWNILAVPQLNNYHGTSSPQLRIIDIKSSYNDIN
ncbi:MAG TPA: single-stranded-DNA-specific exonuclease RecJ [Victivallales bacterium]|nr:single-stranded-DNA-specific exonuclease RecJ [Victivallales bacterium]